MDAQQAGVRPAPDPNPVSAAIFERAKRVMPSGYTRDLVAVKPHPQYAVSGDGCWITDVDGNRVMDWVNNFTALIHGHNKREIVEVIASQAGHLMSAMLPTEWEVQLAELLCERIPGVESVRFMNSGTEANQVVTKIARAYTGKPKIAKMEGGYHGQYDLLEASFQPRPPAWGEARRPQAVAHNPGTPQSLLDELVVLPLNDVDATREILRERAHELAAVILDPFRLQLGMVEPELPYLQMLRDETAKLGILLVFDEVMCLRVGYHGAQGMLGVTPDLTTMGKIIGGGLPIGGVGGSARVMAVFEMDRGDNRVKHSGTYTANPMSMAAGYVGMTLLTREVFARLDAQGSRLREGLEAIRRDLGIEGYVAGKASMSALMLTPNVVRNYRQLAAAVGGGMVDRMNVAQKLMLDEQLLTMRSGFIGSTPMTDDDIEFTLTGVRRAYARMKSM
jgi:glutamate-1-semialdehyde 2,1-aminomutase